jgi:hypothetical protein
MNDFHPLILSVTVSLSSLNVSDTGILLEIVHCLELVIETQCLGAFLSSAKNRNLPIWAPLDGYDGSETEISSI